MKRGQKHRQMVCVLVATAIAFVAMLLMVLFFVKVATATEVQERVIELPQDADKWFVSVIGDTKDAQYQEILKWFDADANLVGLKKQVHFWNVPTSGAAYKERYAKNTSDLPTVRVQKPSGFVVWEGAGDGIPRTARGLYADIAGASAEVMALLPWRRNGTILPWRQQIDGRIKPCPTPCPMPPLPSVPIDPPPAPLDNGGPPEFEDTGPPMWVVIMSAIASALAGGGWGLFSQWREITAG